MMILFNGRHGFDLCDEMGKIIIAVLRQMHFISHPRDRFAFCRSEPLDRRESESTPQPEASALGSGERLGPAHSDIVASRSLTMFGSPEGEKAIACRSLVGYKPAERIHPRQSWY